MKKFLLIVTLILALTLSGCNKYDIRTESSDYRLTIVYSDGYTTIYKDNNTGVQYIRSYDAGICVMLNADGTPYTGD